MIDALPPALQQPLFTRRTLLAAVLMCAACGILLYLAGRPGWCKYGFGIWSPAWSRCTSQNLLDPYSLSHVLHGVIFYWILQPIASRITLPIRVVLALGMEVGWELLENSQWVIERYRQGTASFDYTGDSIINSLSDVVLALLGIMFASRFSWKASIALVVVFEIVMLLLARDNLTLNILMLVSPIEAVKEWQMP